GFQRDEPERHIEIEEHFKYGSVGSDRLGIPYWIWRVLPAVFPDHLPEGPGEDYARFGFIYERGAPKSRPMGVSYREKFVPQVGLNCAVCHTGTVRDYPEAPRNLVIGMPANQFHLQGYIRFLFAAANDKDFNADTLIPAIKEVNPRFSWIDSLAYRFLVIPRTRDGLREQVKDFPWMDSRPDQGLGRVDTFTLFKEITNMQDDTVGTVDLPSLWNQRVRENMFLHWDGNNDSVDERNINAAIGAGGVRGMQENLDHDGITRIGQWIRDLPPPSFPQNKIDRSRVAAGEEVYQTHCAQCHALDGQYVGQVTEIEDIGTDRERMDSFTEELAILFNQTGAGQPWQFSHFAKTNGYANMPLDGIWLRAPYLHNGSVPTLRDLLAPPQQRPKVFYRGSDVYDYDNLGFLSSGPEVEGNGFQFDTSLKGNGNQGHEYGTSLSQQQIDDLLEFLKTQ
ncbi:MAG: c-type cytochrome, partial [Dehalococcoidia bacterium]